MATFLLLLCLSLLLVTTITVSDEGGGGGGGVTNGGELKLNYYSSSCPQAESLGCDASILLDTVGIHASEKDAGLSENLLGFEVIDETKVELEKVCPDVVSCADILALAARDAVSFSFGRNLWDVPTGRRDGRASFAKDVIQNLPSPFSNFTTLQKQFDAKNLSVADLVALSGAHTFGVGHCDAFSKRLYNFHGNGGVDPTLDHEYAAKLKKQCPNPAQPSTFVFMDPVSPSEFDSSYYRTVEQHKGLFQSDASLLNDPISAAILTRLQNQSEFLEAFGRSMVKMGSIEALTGGAGEIRMDCRVIN